MGARVNCSAVRINRENVGCAAFCAYSQPSAVVREAHVSNFGVRVASIQRVKMFDYGARAFE